MMNILLTGGAGYIGSHTVRELERAGFNPVVYDDLSTGFEFLIKGRTLVKGDMADEEMVSFALKQHNIDAVIHFAGFIAAGESVIDPHKYYKNNVAGTINLLNAMVKSNVKNIVFSSTCAVYGDPVKLPLTEDHPKNPVNPYGMTKFFIEKILEDYDRAYGLRHINLRYFNASGADLYDKTIGESHNPESHLIPLVLEAALGHRDNIQIFGTDYDTPDGTCIRDYIHVSDLAIAHILAILKLKETGRSDYYNVGTGNGYSVKEIIETTKRITGLDINVIEKERREGDAVTLIADSGKIKKDLKWEPKHSALDTIIKSAFEWHSSDNFKNLSKK